ncbi:MAG: GNAT family N-acetyltransferase [Leifsonia flava]
MSPAASVTLVDKTPEQLAAWLPISNALYEQARIDAGDSPAEAASAAASSQARFFPDGVPVDGHRIFTITVDEGDAGWLWIGPTADGTGGDWWIWDIEVHEAFRRRGIAEATMLLAEDVARAAGVTAIGLNVFGGNDTARRLYDRVGYSVTSVHMRKNL